LREFALNFDRPAHVQPAGLFLRYDPSATVHSRVAHKRLFDRPSVGMKLSQGARKL